MQFLDQFLKGQVLMSIRSQAHFPHPSQKIAKSRITRKAGAQHQRVDEKSYQTFGLQPVTVSDRRTYDEVVLVRVAL